MKQRPSWEKVYSAINGFAKLLPQGWLAMV